MAIRVSAERSATAAIIIATRKNVSPMDIALRDGLYERRILNGRMARQSPDRSALRCACS
jgi:hypothetical protein